MNYKHLFRAALYLLISTSFCAVLAAQDLYTVRAGVFRNVRSEEFKEVKDLGYVYSLDAGERETEVYIGQFTDQNKATEVAKALTARGFRNALVQNLPAGAGEARNMIQFALHDSRLPIDWKKYEALGPLHAQSIDGALKLFVGPYDAPQTARAALAAVKQQGFQDAFVKVVPSLQLITIDAFETNIKKPLIPIKYLNPKEESATTTPATADSTVTVTPRTAAPTPETYGTVLSSSPPASAPASAPTVATPPPAASPILSPATSSELNLPMIDPATKRHSIAELQTVLKTKGFYNSGIDGLYGAGTTAAYRRSWAELPELRKYRILTNAPYLPVGAETSASAIAWPEVNVLLTIAADLSAGNANTTRANALAGQREQLLTTKEPLNGVAATRTKEWAATVWSNLNSWAEEDPLHAQIITAFRIAYHQTQARLEQHYDDRGFEAAEAKDLAIAMMQNLVGAQLDRFL